MRLKLCTLVGVAACALAVFVGTASAQKPAAEKPVGEARPSSSVPSSAAYAELLLRKTEMQAELESLVLEYTEEFPKVKELRHTLTLIERESARLAKTKANDTSKLTVALGKLIVRKVELETELWTLQKTYKDEHPDVKRAKRKVDIYETAIAELLD
jgi:hypothetical protein